MAAPGIYHKFISPKEDSTDNNLVSSSEWNDAHTLIGGENGQRIIYDITQSNNFRFTDGAGVLSQQQVISTPTPSPITNIANINFLANSPTLVFGVCNIAFFITASGSSATFELMIDSPSFIFATGICNSGAGSTISTTSIVGTITLASGNHNMFLRVTVSGGGNINNLNVLNSLLKVGS